MAKSKYEYVKSFERDDTLLPNAFIVVRVDGQNFHRFSTEHGFAKPNDDRALRLANACAQHVMAEFSDIILAYGESDEYRREADMYGRRECKLVSMVASLFAAKYVFSWPEHFGGQQLQYPPSFDARAIVYPTLQNLRDYLSWRQADCHINNLYNTAFWALVQRGGKSAKEAEAVLAKTNSGQKNEILFTDYQINYNSLPEMYRKGTTIYKKRRTETLSNQYGEYHRMRSDFIVYHGDVIQDEFWTEHFSDLT